jgi:hypothetical protein
MPAPATIDKLRRAGISCRALWSYLLCSENGSKDRCENCWMDGPEGCADTVIAALVDRLLASVHQTDQVLAQRDYWHGVVDRLTAALMDDTELEED